MSYRMALLAAFSNYLIFFGPDIFHRGATSRATSQRGDSALTRRRAVRPEPLHRCAICGATELSDPNLDFRVARDGEEYCIPHLPKGDATLGS